MSAKTGIFFSLPPTGLNNIDVAAEMRTIAKPVVINESGKRCANHDPPKFVTKPSAQITSASFISTSLLRNLEMSPDTAALKTIARAAVVAWAGEKLNP